MKTHTLALLAAITALFVAGACTVDTTGAGGATSGTAPTGGMGTGGSTTVTATSGATTASSSGTGGGDCKGIFADGDCALCGEAVCCAQGAACRSTKGCIGCVYSSDPSCTVENKAVVDAFLACLETSCKAECSPAPPPVDATCTVPQPSPSSGACVTLGGNIECNPVTNELCDTAKGEACDFDGAGYRCYPAPNERKVCETCGPTKGGGNCQGGLSCMSAPEGKCAKFCCNEGDCGAGKCEKQDGFSGGIGYCVGGN